jgi:hypothetical protein
VWPALGRALRNDYARGAISGLGVVNLMAGLTDLLPIFAGRSRRQDVHDVP